jgi:hypothetical protein
MPKVTRVHSTPRRSASLRKTSPALRAPLPAALPSIDPETLPDLYCMGLDGDCFEPLIPDHAAVMIKKSEPFGVGDVVCIWWRPGFVKRGMRQSWLKRVRLSAPPWVKQYPYNDHPQSDVKAVIVVEQINPPATYAVPCEHILAIHKAVGYSPAGGKIGGTVSSGDMLPIGKAVQP